MSELVFLILVQVLEHVCEEMGNYSTFTRHNVTRFERYQKRPGQKGVLNLTDFSWSGTRARVSNRPCESLMCVPQLTHSA